MNESKPVSRGRIVFRGMAVHGGGRIGKRMEKKFLTVSTSGT